MDVPQMVSGAWNDRWFFLCFLPLIVGALFASLVVWCPRRTRHASRPRGAVARTQDDKADLAGKLTFLGTAAVAGAGIFNFTVKVATPDDLGVLLAANVVFVAIAASHTLLFDWSRHVGLVAVLSSSVASLASIGSMVCRSPLEIVPLHVKVFFWVLLLLAALLVSAYVRVRVNTN